MTQIGNALFCFFLVPHQKVRTGSLRFRFRMITPAPVPSFRFSFCLSSFRAVENLTLNFFSKKFGSRRSHCQWVPVPSGLLISAAAVDLHWRVPPYPKQPNTQTREFNSSSVFGARTHSGIQRRKKVWPQKVAIAQARCRPLVWGAGVRSVCLSPPHPSKVCVPEISLKFPALFMNSFSPAHKFSDVGGWVRRNGQAPHFAPP